MCGKRILQSCSASSIHRKYSGSTCKCNAKISWSCAQQTCAGCECWTINLIRAKSPEVTLRDGPIPVWVRMILSHGSWYVKMGFSTTPMWRNLKWCWSRGLMSSGATSTMPEPLLWRAMLSMSGRPMGSWPCLSWMTSTRSRTRVKIHH